MEYGVGFNTPSIIRFSFERMTYNNSNAMLIRLNKDYQLGEKELLPYIQLNCIFLVTKK